METDFLTGWDHESEVKDFDELMRYQEFCGEQFIYDWSEVRERIYEETRLYNGICICRRIVILGRTSIGRIEQPNQDTQTTVLRIQRSRILQTKNTRHPQNKVHKRRNESIKRW